MDEEQVRALIATALGESNATLKTELLSQLDAKNSGLAASLTREFKKIVEPLQTKPDPTTQPPAPEAGTGEGEGKLTLKALQSQLQEQTKMISSLKEESDRKDRETSAAKRKSALATAIAEAGTLNPSLLQKVLDLDFGEHLKEENGAWYLQRGESVATVKDALSTYLATDEGKAFLPSSGTQGAGSTSSKSSSSPPPVTSDGKAVDLLNSAFEGF